MPAVYSATVKTARMQAVVDAIGSSGVLEVGTIGMGMVLVSFALNNPAGTVSGPTMTLSGFPKVSNATGNGVAQAARIRTATGGTDVVTGLTVGLANTDIVLNSMQVNSGQPVTLNGAALTHG